MNYNIYSELLFNHINNIKIYITLNSTNLYTFIIVLNIRSRNVIFIIIKLNIINQVRFRFNIVKKGEVNLYIYLYFVIIKILKQVKTSR